MLEVDLDVRNNISEDQGGASFLVQVVHLYYQRRATQKDIAERLGVSAMTVSRALKRAEEEGLVEVRLHLPIRNDARLEADLKAGLDFREVFVVCPPEEARGADGWGDDPGLDLLGRAAALFSSPSLRDGVVLGTALGRTMGYVAQHIPRRRLRDAKVVQVMGGLGKSAVHNPYNVVQAVSHRLHAQGSYFSGSAFVANRAVQEAMLEENVRSGLRDLWRACDLCLVGVGSCSANVPYIDSGLVTEEELFSVVAKGAVGDLLGRYFDIEGRFVETELHERVNAIPLSDLRHAKQVVITACGPEKVLPIVGAARTGLPLSLVTDVATARAVLEHLDASA